MRVYSRDDEERVRLQARVRDWTGAGLLDASQGATLDASLRTDLRRTNAMLRAVLALFTAVIVAAAAGLFVAFFQIRGDLAIALWLAIAAVAAIAVAEWLIATARLYRFGVEEALVTTAAAMASLSVMMTLSAARSPPVDSGWPVTLAWTNAAAAAACLAMFARYGVVYGGVAAMAFAAAVPFQLHWQPWIPRVIAAGVLTLAFVVARRHHRRYGDDYPGDGSAILQAVAWLGVYLVINVQLTFAITGISDRSVPRWFYWTTYGVVWIMPTIGLWLGLRDKDRPLMAVNTVLGIVTLATNKSYLGWPRHSWDPMILGVLLIGSALWIRRWLASAPGGQRFGFTPARILEGDREVVTAFGNLAAAWHPHAIAPPEQSDPRFGGGRSGGGGATGSF